MPERSLLQELNRVYKGRSSNLPANAPTPLQIERYLDDQYSTAVEERVEPGNRKKKKKK